MKTLLRFLAIFALAVSASAVDIKPPVFVPASGLQLSLNTGGYKFFVGDTTPPLAAAKARATKLGGLLPTREGFAASAVLANTSRSAIPFEFNDAGAAAVKFKFSVSDVDGALVWQSDTNLISAQVITPATLGKGERWKRVLQIPLKVDGAWLKPGIYTLEARLAATPSVFAATIFEVAGFLDAPIGESGISGHVFEQGAVDTGSAIVAPTPVKAFVSIMEKRLPNARYDHPAFSWTGSTDEEGNFKVATPPGTFIVTAFRTPTPAVTPLANTLTNLLVNRGQVTSAEVAVESGRYSEVTLTFQSTPPATTGIKGLVLIGPVRPVEVVGESNEQPLAGALVQITEIQTPGVYYFRGPWTWTLTAGPDGKFSQATPPGRYRVTASVPVVAPPIGGPVIALANRWPIGSGTVEVTVPTSGFAEVTIHVDSGIR